LIWVLLRIARVPRTVIAHCPSRADQVSELSVHCQNRRHVTRYAVIWEGSCFLCRSAFSETLEHLD
jgi:hypothetical protein